MRQTSIIKMRIGGMNLHFGELAPISQQMEAQRDWKCAELGNVLRDEEQSQEVQTDSLLALVGTLKYQTIDIRGTTPVEMQQANESQKTEGTDPLLGLIGTLECEATDIGERHDDYIGDTMLTELTEGDDDG